METTAVPYEIVRQLLGRNLGPWNKASHHQSIYLRLLHDIEKDLFDLVELCTEILVDNPLFFIINSYTAGLSPIVLDNILKIFLGDKSGTITSGELGIKAKNGLILPAGVYARYER